MTNEKTEAEDGEQLRRNYAQLTPKQRSVVDVLVEGDFDTYADAADKAGVCDSYVHYVRDEYGHVIEQRDDHMSGSLEKPVTDGKGETYIDVRWTEDEAFRAMRILPADLSRIIYESVRGKRE